MTFYGEEKVKNKFILYILYDNIYNIIIISVFLSPLPGLEKVI